MPVAIPNFPDSCALRAIVYVSTATRMMDAAALEWLLKESRSLNLAAGITGVLLYSDGNFMQYFEGSEMAMPVTYERILRSSRHKDINELLNLPITARSFPDWQMGLAQPSKSEMLALTTARWKIRARVVDSAPLRSPGFELLRNFWRHARR